MCGITGIHTHNIKGISKDTLLGMTRSLKHRGPDDCGTHVINMPDMKIGLGHARLSIIDLSKAGHQPMCNEDGTIWITYNGEIYNYRELRDDLIATGHVFRSDTDTEVIIHGFEEYGEKIFNKLNGMFAFGLWDNNLQALYLVRDRYGQKPLYYRHDGKSLIFASELKALLIHPDIPKTIDHENLCRYLLYEYVPAPHSIIKGINKLLPGHFLCYKNQGMTITPYWSINLSAHDVYRDENEIQEVLREKLKRSISRRLMSDVPLGVFLSGGVDSSAIVALMSELMPADQIKTFCIGFDEKSFDESNYSREVAAYFHTDHHEQTLKPKTMLEILPKVWDFLDEPFADASIIPTYLLSKFTRENVTVALGGDGGDELFAGYDPFLAHGFAGLYDRMPASIHQKILNPVIQRFPVSTDNMSFDFRLKQFMKGIPYPLRIRNQVWLGSFSDKEQRSLLHPDFIAGLNGFDLYNDIHQACEGMHFNNWINETIYLYSRFYLSDDILTKVDRASMATSLEVRAPFLDVDFAEFANSIPAKLKLHGLTRKYILKKSLKGILPKHIIHRNKKGFGIPLSKWFRNELKPILYDTFSPSRVRQQGIFNADVIQKMIAEHCEGKKDNRKQLWTLLMFEQWRERYV